MFQYARNTALVLAHAYQQRIVGFPPPGFTPYMPVDEVEFFKEQLSHCRHYVEFGTGGSTVYASLQGVQTISVENDAFYARTVTSQLAGSSVTQIVASLGPSMAWGMPAFPRVKLARRYVMAPWNLETFPDFILVDGRYRAACALAASCMAHKQGARAVIMFDDYIDRPGYHVVEEFLGHPQYVGRAAIFSVGKQDVPMEVMERWLHDPG